jgi:thiaminase/transcriptional activator TenA
MAVMEEAIRRALEIWNACLETPFVRELGTGELAPQIFRRYLIQDSIFLKQYARVFGQAIYLAEAWEDIRACSSLLSYLCEGELAARQRWLGQEDCGEAEDPLPANKAYTDFLLEAAARGDREEMLMAVLPCLLSYAHVAEGLAADPLTRRSAYWDFIRDYANPEYAATCARWRNLAEARFAGLSPERLEALWAVFVRASELELAFWKMAYDG